MFIMNKDSWLFSFQYSCRFWRDESSFTDTSFWFIFLHRRPETVSFNKLQYITINHVANIWIFTFLSQAIKLLCSVMTFSLFLFFRLVMLCYSLPVWYVWVWLCAEHLAALMHQLALRVQSFKEWSLGVVSLSWTRDNWNCLSTKDIGIFHAWK